MKNNWYDYKNKNKMFWGWNIEPTPTVLLYRPVLSWILKNFNPFGITSRLSEINILHRIGLKLDLCDKYNLQIN